MNGVSSFKALVVFPHHNPPGRSTIHQRISPISRPRSATTLRMLMILIYFSSRYWSSWSSRIYVWHRGWLSRLRRLCRTHFICLMRLLITCVSRRHISSLGTGIWLLWHPILIGLLHMNLQVESFSKEAFSWSARWKFWKWKYCNDFDEHDDGLFTWALCCKHLIDRLEDSRMVFASVWTNHSLSLHGIASINREWCTPLQ
jgi:hypothetical protein